MDFELAVSSYSATDKNWQIQRTVSQEWADGSGLPKWLWQDSCWMCISEAGRTIKKAEVAATAKKKASVWTDLIKSLE